MSVKGNFMKALNEISGAPGPSTSSPEDRAGSSADSPSSGSRSEPSSHNFTPATGRSVIPPYAPPTVSTSARTIITKDTQINGSLITSSALDIAGTVIGDIQCEADMRITGKVEGNVSAQSIEMSGSRIKGDVTVKGTAYVRQGSVMVGNLQASEAEVNGSIKGDLQIENTVQVLMEAHVVGDVKASILEISKGAAVQGRLMIKTSENRPDPFID